MEKIFNSYEITRILELSTIVLFQFFHIFQATFQLNFNIFRHFHILTKFFDTHNLNLVLNPRDIYANKKSRTLSKISVELLLPGREIFDSRYVPVVFDSRLYTVIKIKLRIN